MTCTACLQQQPPPPSFSCPRRGHRRLRSPRPGCLGHRSAAPGGPGDFSLSSSRQPGLPGPDAAMSGRGERRLPGQARGREAEAGQRPRSPPRAGPPRPVMSRPVPTRPAPGRAKCRRARERPAARPGRGAARPDPTRGREDAAVPC